MLSTFKLWSRVQPIVAELKRRKVYRVAVAYAAVAFVVVETADLIFPALNIPSWAYSLLVVVTLLGFPVALVLAWAFELTPEGMRRTEANARIPQNREGVAAAAIGFRHRPVLAIGVSLMGVGALAWAGYAFYASDASVDGVPEIRSLAVLPLDNLSGDPEQEYFTDGMTEALTAELGQISALKVTSRTSGMRYKDTDKRLPEIARELGVDGLIEGSVLKAEDRVRITLQLVHGPTDRHLWSQSYQRNLRNVLVLQSEVAREIADEIELTVTPEEEARFASARPVDPEAYRLYALGQFQLGRMTEAAFRHAREHFEEAIAIDPCFAPAHAALAMALIELGSWWSSSPPQEVYVQARAGALEALKCDSTLAEAHIALGRIKHLFEWDWAGAEAAFRRGIAFNSSATHARIIYANYLMAMGRFEEAASISRQTLEYDPTSHAAYRHLGWALDRLGQDDEALAHYQTAVELAPNVFPPYLRLVEFHLRRGRLEEASQYLDRAETVLGDALVPTAIAHMGYYYGSLGRRAEALRLLNELETRAEEGYVIPNGLALVYLGLDEKDMALEWLERGYEIRDVTSVWHKARWLLDPLRDEPRFQLLLDRMNFPEE